MIFIFSLVFSGDSMQGPGRMQDPRREITHVVLQVMQVYRGYIDDLEGREVAYGLLELMREPEKNVRFVRGMIEVLNTESTNAKNSDPEKNERDVNSSVHSDDSIGDGSSNCSSGSNTPRKDILNDYFGKDQQDLLCGYEDSIRLACQFLSDNGMSPQCVHTLYERYKQIVETKNKYQLFDASCMSACCQSNTRFAYTLVNRWLDKKDSMTTLPEKTFFVLCCLTQEFLVEKDEKRSYGRFDVPKRRSNLPGGDKKSTHDIEFPFRASRANLNDLNRQLCLIMSSFIYTYNGLSLGQSLRRELCKTNMPFFHHKETVSSFLGFLREKKHKPLFIVHSYKPGDSVDTETVKEYRASSKKTTHGVVVELAAYNFIHPRKLALQLAHNRGLFEKTIENWANNSTRFTSANRVGGHNQFCLRHVSPDGKEHTEFVNSQETALSYAHIYYGCTV